MPRVRALAATPDGFGEPQAIAALIDRLLGLPSVVVPAVPGRRELDAGETLDALRAAAPAGARPPAGARLDYRFDLGPDVRVIVLDLVRRDGGSDGIVAPAQPAWLARELAAAGERWVLVVSHQPLSSSRGGEALLELLDRHPRTLAALCGHIHRNQITPRRTAGGGYWLIATASLIDYPQQARALRIRATEGGGAAIETWMLDHVADGGGLGDIARELSYLDAQGGRPQGFAGSAARPQRQALPGAAVTGAAPRNPSRPTSARGSHQPRRPCRETGGRDDDPEQHRLGGPRLRQPSTRSLSATSTSPKRTAGVRPATWTLTRPAGDGDDAGARSRRRARRPRARRGARGRPAVRRRGRRAA